MRNLFTPHTGGKNSVNPSTTAALPLSSPSSSQHSLSSSHSLLRCKHPWQGARSLSETLGRWAFGVFFPDFCHSCWWRRTGSAAGASWPRGVCLSSEPPAQRKTWKSQWKASVNETALMSPISLCDDPSLTCCAAAVPDPDCATGPCSSGRSASPPPPRSTPARLGFYLLHRTSLLLPASLRQPQKLSSKLPWLCTQKWSSEFHVFVTQLNRLPHTVCILT